MCKLWLSTGVLYGVVMGGWGILCGVPAKRLAASGEVLRLGCLTTVLCGVFGGGMGGSGGAGQGLGGLVNWAGQGRLDIYF